MLPRNVLDNPHNPKTWKYYDENFAVEVYFADAAAASTDASSLDAGASTTAPASMGQDETSLQLSDSTA